MATQYLALVEETTRGTDPGSGYLFLPVTGTLSPKFDPKDEPRKEFRGADTALGDSSVRRVESKWTHTLECSWYPGAEVGLLFKHLLGFAGSRTVVDTTAYKGVLYPLAMQYGTGQNLANKAIGLLVNSDENGTTKMQYFGGGRIKSCTITIKGTDDIKLSFEIQGAGGWVGTPDQTATAGVSFPAASPFISCDTLCYSGSGISRTGTPPALTAIAAGSMTAFTPESVTITITNGEDDRTVLNGVRGPSKTYRENQFKVETDVVIDYEDPSSGFSSADEFKRIFAGTATQALLLKLDNLEHAGSVSAHYESWLDLPNMMLTAETPERNTEGKTPSVKLKYTSLYDSTLTKPFALFTQDKATAY